MRGKWRVRMVWVALSLLGVSLGWAGPSCLAAGPGPSLPVCACRDMTLTVRVLWDTGSFSTFFGLQSGYLAH